MASRRVGTSPNQAISIYFGSKTIAQEGKVVSRRGKTLLLHTHRMKRMNRKRCSELSLGPHLPHAPGARMTVVKQTPSNKKILSRDESYTYFERRKNECHDGNLPLGSGAQYNVELSSEYRLRVRFQSQLCPFNIIRA